MCTQKRNKDGDLQTWVMVSILFADFRTRNQLNENVRRMREIQRRCKQREAEKQECVKVLWKSQKYSTVESKIKQDVEVFFFIFFFYFETIKIVYILFFRHLVWGWFHCHDSQLVNCYFVENNIVYIIIYPSAIFCSASLCLFHLVFSPRKSNISITLVLLICHLIVICHFIMVLMSYLAVPAKVKIQMIFYYVSTIFSAFF